jgi:hypothetical protein
MFHLFNHLFKLLFLMTAMAAQAGFHPKSFPLSTTPGDMAVFVDFQVAKYKIVYDVKAAKATYVATIKFNQQEAGKPIFDVVTNPLKVSLDGLDVKQTLVSTPKDESKVRVVQKSLLPGTYTLTVEGNITNLVTFDAANASVRAAHWTSDLEDRNYLEAYLPSNYEFDQYAMTYDVKITGTEKLHKVYTNGELIENRDVNNFTINFPKYFTSSSAFYHVAPEDAFVEDEFTFSSVSGVEIPVLVYGVKGRINFDSFKKLTLSTLAELENDYGAFKHSKVVIYNNGSGGMEYCGATMTSLWALAHELTHSYFARGLMPANGNAGWIDEALASWRDDGYQTRTTLSGNRGMASHDYYRRDTDQAAYTFGADFMSYLDGKLQGLERGGLKPFLRHAVDTKVFVPYTTEDFITWMNFFYSASFDADFKKYVYANSLTPAILPRQKTQAAKDEREERFHRIHKKMSFVELAKYL